MKKFFVDMFWGCIGLMAFLLLGPDDWDNNFPQDDFKTWD